MIVWPLALLQGALGARVALRLYKTAGGRTIEQCQEPTAERVSVIVPVLNEAARLQPCLESLIAQPGEVAEILVVDGGSTDGTQSLIQRLRRRDPRIRLVEAAPQERWTGKAYGLHAGLEQTDARCEWVLCVDADTRCAPALVRSLLNHARRAGLAAFSLATTQRVAGPADAAVHASLLATLVYRYGIPGHTATRISEAQANGQCFFARRKTLVDTGAFAAARHSLCEDITTVRRLVECGERVGFYLGPGLVEVGMYAGWRETWRNWPRSLVMRDQYFGLRQCLGMLEVLLVQAAPLPVVAVHSVFRLPRPLMLVNFGLLAMRMGVLAGMAPAYRPRHYSYWASPVIDLPAAIRLVVTLLARRHVWRGRTYVRQGRGQFHAAEDFQPERQISTAATRRRGMP